MDAEIVEAKNLVREFDAERWTVADRFGGRPKQVIRAVDGVDISIRAGEVVGLVGESGSGKSTLGRVVAGLTPPSSGKISLFGKSLDSLRENEIRKTRQQIQLVFQDAIGSLSPRRRIGSLITEPYRIHKVPEPERRTAAELLDLVGLSQEFEDRFPHELSGGQARRVVLARALSLGPELMIADEPTAGLDVSTAAAILNLLRELSDREDMAVLLITHDLAAVASVADRIVVMYLGQVVESGPVADVLLRPAHPYTRALRSAVAIPAADSPGERIVLKGPPPDPANPPSGCRFRSRCPWARIECQDPPELGPFERVEVRCHFAQTVRGSQPPGSVRGDQEAGFLSTGQP